MNTLKASQIVNTQIRWLVCYSVTNLIPNIDQSLEEANCPSSSLNQKSMKSIKKKKITKILLPKPTPTMGPESVVSYVGHCWA